MKQQEDSKVADQNWSQSRPQAKERGGDVDGYSGNTEPKYGTGIAVVAHNSVDRDSKRTRDVDKNADGESNFRKYMSITETERESPSKTAAVDKSRALQPSSSSSSSSSAAANRR